MCSNIDLNPSHLLTSLNNRIKMYELINYDRHVLGMESVEYEEVYHHYIDRVNAFNEKYDADIEQGDLGTLDESTKGKKKEYKLI